MSKLREKLLAAVAFDPRLKRGDYRPAIEENARLTPLLTALIDCACALDRVAYDKGRFFEELAALERAVGTKE